MDINKTRHMTIIRENTAYPTYRALINVTAIFGYAFTIFVLITCLVTGIGKMKTNDGLVTMLAGIILSVILYLSVRFTKEASLILADIADSITETNSRTTSDS